MAISLEVIRNKHRSRKKRINDLYAFNSFYKLFDPAADLMMEVIELKRVKKLHRNKFNKKLRDIAISNFVVNVVTAFELYFKSIIVMNEGWDETGYSSLLKEKITLSEAYDLFNKERVSREYVVAHYYSFQNFEKIGDTFSKLINRDFFKEIENHQSRWGDSKAGNEYSTILIEEHPNWRETLARIYNFRNLIVHEGVIVNLKVDDVFEIYLTATDFQLAMDNYFDKRFNP